MAKNSKAARFALMRRANANLVVQVGRLAVAASVALDLAVAAAMPAAAAAAAAMLAAAAVTPAAAVRQAVAATAAVLLAAAVHLVVRRGRHLVHHAVRAAASVRANQILSEAPVGTKTATSRVANLVMLPTLVDARSAMLMTAATTSLLRDVDTMTL